MCCCRCSGFELGWVGFIVLFCTCWYLFLCWWRKLFAIFWCALCRKFLLVCCAFVFFIFLTKKSMGADKVDLCVLVSFMNKEIKSFLFLWDMWKWVSSLRRLWSVCVSQGRCLATFPTEFSPPLVHLPPHLPPDPCLMTTRPSCPYQKVCLFIGGWYNAPLPLFP